jgi:hypothetical protein
MEMRFLLFNKLGITVGEIGPVEFECFISSLFFLTGSYFGSECMTNTLGNTFSLDKDNIVAEVEWKFVWGCIIAVLVPIFISENLIPCFTDKDSKVVIHAFWLLLPIILIYVSLFLTTSLPVFITHRAYIYLMHNFAIACVCLNCMLDNMAKKPFT